MRHPRFAIVGQPNVGKSTLFNALTQRSISIVDRTWGTTRDRLSATININPNRNQLIELIDTGGLIQKDLELKDSSRTDKNPILSAIQEQVQSAIKEADALILVVDVRHGANPIDQWITRHLRQAAKPLLLVANKADTPKHDSESSEFFSLGLGQPLAISALNRRGLDQLFTQLRYMTRSIKVTDTSEPPQPLTPTLKLAIVGKRNAGKSTLVNNLAGASGAAGAGASGAAGAGAERVIVSEIPGTTRDAIDIKFTRDNKSFLAIDTAGLLHRSKITESVDFHSQSRTKRAIQRADVVLLLLDAQTRVSELDKQISGFLIEETKACVLVVNKWDLVSEKIQPDDYLKYLNKTLPGLQFAPISFIAAKKGFNTWATIELAEDLYQQSSAKVKTPLLNKILQRAHITRRPKGREPKIYYAAQTGIHPPTITLKVNQPNLFTQDTQRYLINILRRHLPFKEVPIRLRLQGRPSKKGAKL